MAWDEHGSATAVNLLVHDRDGQTAFKDKVWLTFISTSLNDEAGAKAMLHRPDYTPPRGPTQMMMQDHIPDVGTGAYDDVEKCLAMIHLVMVVQKGLKMVFVFGDNQVGLTPLTSFRFVIGRRHLVALHHLPPFNPTVI